MHLSPRWLRLLSVLRRWFCCCWLFVYCYSHCGSRNCTMFCCTLLYVHSSRIRFSIVILCLWVLERCPDKLFKDCHRQTPKPVVWTHSLAITPQPKGAIFSHRKRWVVLTWTKHHTIMWKQRFQHLKAFFIHFIQFYGPWITHKK